jgi:hypothetical protein
MMLKQFGVSNDVMFAFLSISLLLCTGIALGSTLDVYVDYKGIPAGQASIYLDNDTYLGQTISDGTFNDVYIAPGFHTVVANWQDGNGQQRSGTRSFTACNDSYTQLRIDLNFPRNLGWIWQLLTNS